MSDKLLDHYEKEFAFLQESAADFARQHPGSAGRLQLSADTVDDPLVGRLLAGTAYLNARIQQKLDDELPQLSDAMLDTLYPHYTRPIPAMTVVQFQAEADLDALAHVDRGALLQTSAVAGNSCHFTTSYPVDIHPCQVTQAALNTRPFVAPGSAAMKGAAGVLHIALQGISKDFRFGDAPPEALRFFLRGQNQHSFPLYDLLLNKTLKIALARSEHDEQPIFINSSCIQPVGFEEDEGLLPYPSNAFIGYRLLTEFFVFPKKFLFLDFQQLAGAITADFGNELHLYIYLSESDEELEHHLSASNFALGCSPAVNLFPQTGDPIQLDHLQHQYRIVPDARSPEGMEVYSIDSVNGLDSDAKVYEYTPFYGRQHRHHEGTRGNYWHAQRSAVTEGEHLNETASEMDITLVDLDFNPYTAKDQTLQLSLTCFNRNQPQKLPTGNSQPWLTEVNGSSPVSRIVCLVAPTPTLRPLLKSGAYWRLISHLNLNHLSLGDGESGCQAFKEILRLYDFSDSPSTRKLIESLRDMHTKAITAPIQAGSGIAMCRGTEIHIELDPVMMIGTSPLLFASVIERFMGLYCSLNSFTRLITTLSGKEGELKRWPPRAGDKALI
ncbi:type VI secretion protein [Gammaproteobacteria bacterium 53_120_T64]|nr:type VI secretion protein [Gammaproteobacteria bacterium 53_120_T64]